MSSGVRHTDLNKLTLRCLFTIDHPTDGCREPSAAFAARKEILLPPAPRARLMNRAMADHHYAGFRYAQELRDIRADLLAIRRQDHARPAPARFMLHRNRLAVQDEKHGGRMG